ncbi:MAG: asparagine synthase-related protein [Betaproteobacteria bacterium]
MAAPLARFDRSVVRSASARFGAVAVAVTPGDHADLYRSEEQLAAVWGRPRFADGDLARFAEHHGNAHALAEGYGRKGNEIFTAMTGSFALAIQNIRRGEAEAVLATDRMGTRPLAYSVIGKKLAFGSTLDAIGALPGVKAELDHQAVYDYTYFHMIPAPGSIAASIARLSLGEYLSFRDGMVTTGRYWETHFVEYERRRSFVELRQGLLGVLRESVREAARGGSVGAFLSGGTDSSTIAGMLGEVTGEPARTYSIGFDAAGYDEMEYARIAARHFGTRHHEYYVTPDDVVAAIPLIAAVHDQPFGNASAVPTFYCARLAREDGIETLLGGDGGDELFGGNTRYAKQQLYSIYSDLPLALRQRLIEPMAFALPSVSLIGKAQRYMRTASQPMPARYDNYNLLEHFGAANVFTPEFLAAVDPARPQVLMAETYQRAHANTLINRMLAFDFKYTLADNDLPKVTRSCELAGINVGYPMLDEAVVAFSASLPPGLKLKGTRLRYFFKEALRGFLPDQILTKSKHGFGLPFGRWLQTHKPLQAIAMDSLADLKKRQLVRAAFIDELTSRHVQGHAAYYGTMIWVLMMLEQWFVQHRSMAAPVPGMLQSDIGAEPSAIPFVRSH